MLSDSSLVYDTNGDTNDFGDDLHKFGDLLTLGIQSEVAAPVANVGYVDVVHTLQFSIVVHVPRCLDVCSTNTRVLDDSTKDISKLVAWRSLEDPYARFLCHMDTRQKTTFQNKDATLILLAIVFSV